METRVVAKVIVVNSDDQVLLLQRSEDDPRRPLQWDIPGGHTDGDEFAEEAAARETLEETGIKVEARQLRLVRTRTQLVTPEINVNWLFYVAHVDKPEAKISSEHAAFRWVSLDEALKLIDYDVQKELFQYVKDNNLL